MDDNTFFKQATLLICSSLDIHTALHRCLKFISTTLPADCIHLDIFDLAHDGVRFIAGADSAKGWRKEKIIKLSEDVLRYVEEGCQVDWFQNQMIINRPDQDPLGRIIIAAFNMPETSIIVQRLIIEGHCLGIIHLLANGYDRFTPEHARQFALLQEPFAIAMANAIKHQAIVDLKERLISDNCYLNRELLSRSGDEVVGADTGLREVMHQVRRIAHLTNTVLLLGETGTGKEVVANAIHRLSPRSNDPFIKVNCGAIPENLIDSELFGYEKGAFTGAAKQTRGRFERANKGTILLDEIGELPLWAQVRLLRVLQTSEIERVGGSPPIKLDIRVLVATHRDLEKMVEAGSFRRDLWFRINAFPINIPPLRERKADIHLLVDHFVQKKSIAFGINPIPTVDLASLESLGQHSWLGNVRELENVVERALILHQHGPLNFGQTIQAIGAFSPPSYPASHLAVHTMEDVMRRHILEVLHRTKGKVNGADGAAVALGINPNTLRTRMKKMGIVFGRRTVEFSPKREADQMIGQTAI